MVNDVPVRRFPVSRERDVDDFGRRSTQVFEESHSVAAELAWLRSEGPTSPALVNHLRRHATDYDYCIFFSFRYYHAYHGLRVTDGRGLLVPTAERDAPLGLRIFGGSFRRVRALGCTCRPAARPIPAVDGHRGADHHLCGTDR